MTPLEQEVRSVVIQSIGYGEARNASDPKMGLNAHDEKYIIEATAKICELVEKKIANRIPNNNGYHYDIMRDCFINQMGDTYKKL